MFSQWLDILIVALAVARLSAMLVTEEGPYEMLARLRNRIGIRFDEFSFPYPTTELSKLFSCVYCMSVWVGVFFTVLYFFLPKVAVVVSFPFALSSVAILFYAKTEPRQS